MTPIPTGATDLHTRSHHRHHAEARPTDLVDPVCGIIRRVITATLPDGAPVGYLSRVAVVADTRYLADDWLADRLGGGTSWGDPRTATLAAVGEAVERYCGNLIPADLPTGTVTGFRRRGIEVVGPGELPAFGADQLRRPGFRYRGWDEDTEIRWATGVRDDDGQRVLIPGSHVYLNWHGGQRRHEPRIVHLQYSGIATGAGIADAADRALAEVVERDAFVAWWTLGLPAVGIDIDTVPELAAAFADCPLALTLQALPSEFGLPVVVAAVTDSRHRIVVAGVSANVDPAAAARKAAAEAVQVWTSARGLLEPDGVAFRAVHEGVFSPKVFLPYRVDRRYRRHAGQRWENIRDLAAHVQLWLDPDIQRQYADRFRPVECADAAGAARRALAIAANPTGADRSARPARVPTTTVADTAELRHRLALSGRRPVTVDLTTPDVADVGWAVARTVVPGLLTNAPAAFAYLGTPRLSELAARFGRPDRPLTLAPPPHN